MQLSHHDLSPIRKGNLELKFFRIPKQMRLNEWKYNKKRTFQVSDIIKHTRYGRVRYGRIISFVHPDGLYTDSNERYNGKDLIECVAIKEGMDCPEK